MSIFNYTQLKIYEPSFTFLKFYLHAKNQIWFINFFKRYSWFRCPTIWMAESISNHSKLKIYKLSFMFLESLPACQKSIWSNIFFLRYSWFKNPTVWLAISSKYWSMVFQYCFISWSRLWTLYLDAYGAIA